MSGIIQLEPPVPLLYGARMIYLKLRAEVGRRCSRHLSRPFATETDDNDTAIPLVKRLLDQCAPGTFVLSLQNGVAGPYALAEGVGANA